MRSRPIIHETAVIANMRPNNPIGEALSRNDTLPTKPMSGSHRALTVSRLEKAVTNLINRASQTYKTNCYKSDTSEIDLDYIARLSTNEFFFYTREPLTLKEFEQLHNKIAETAKKHPTGVHLILGSFAVKTEDDRVMNVVPYITCGQPPQFQFIVKNHTSSLDPRYNIPDGEGNTTLLKKLDKTTHNKALALPNISIDGVTQTFTFNNIVSCKTPGGTPFLTAVDICLDHKYAIAKKNLAELADIQDTPVSHVVISNWIHLVESQSVVKNVMHVDPKLSPTQCRQNTAQQTTSSFELIFGQDPVSFYNLDKYPLSTLQEEYAEAQKESAEAKSVFITMLESLGIKISNQSPLQLTFHPSQQLDFQSLEKQLHEHGIAYQKTGGYSLEIADDMLARGTLAAIGRDMILKQQEAIYKPWINLLQAHIPGISKTKYDINPDPHTLQPVVGIHLLFDDPANAETFLTIVQQVDPAFAITIQTIPQAAFITCGLALLTNNTFLNSVIARYNKADFAKKLATPDIQLISESPVTLRFTTPLLALSIKRYLDTRNIPYSHNAPLDLVIADAFFENHNNVKQLSETLHSPDDIQALRAAVKKEQKIVQELLAKLITAQTTMKQEQDALIALKSPPTGTNTLLRTIDNTLESASKTITGMQNYLDNPHLHPITKHLPVANQILNHTFPEITNLLKGTREHLLQVKLNDVGTYYEKQMFSFFNKVSYKNLEGSDAKIKILNEFKKSLMKINSVEEMQAFKDSLQDANHRNGQRYNLLTLSQNLPKEKTNSVIALEQMIQEREERIVQADSLKF